MEKTLLEKRIFERAKQKTDQEYKEFIDILYKNKFASELKVIIGDNDTIESIPLVEKFNNALFESNILRNKYIDKTNLKEVYNKILEENIKKETDNILEKLDNIKYLF